MALPLSRDTTYAAGVPVESADLNNLQDAVINASHGYKTKRVHVSEGYKVDTGVPELIGDFATISTTNDDVRIPVPLPEGAILNAVTVYGENIGAPGAALPDCELRELSMDNYATDTSTLLTKAVTEAGSGAWTVEFTDSDSGIPHTTVAARAYQMRITGQASTNTIRVYGLDFEYYLPNS